LVVILLTKKDKPTTNHLKKGQIILAKVSDSLGSPEIQSLVDYPHYQGYLKDSRVLWGVDEAELRVISVDNARKTVKVSFHASSVLNPNVSTGRAILLTYTSMRNTVTYILSKLFL